MGLPRAGLQDFHKIVATNGGQRSGQIRESSAGFEPLPDALRFTASVEAGSVRQMVRPGNRRAVTSLPVTGCRSRSWSGPSTALAGRHAAGLSPLVSR